MSNPVTNVEIEDVLSSIRRLVTEDNRTEPAKVRLAEPEPAERLVLTPAQRVGEGVQGSDTKPAGDPPAGALALDAYRTDAPATRSAGAFRTARQVTDAAGPDKPQDASQDNTAADRDSSQEPPWKNRDSFLFQATQLVHRTDAAKRDRLLGDDAKALSDLSSEAGAEPEHLSGVSEAADEGASAVTDQTETRSSPEHGAPSISAAVESQMPDDTDTDADAAQTSLRAASLSAKIEALEAAIAETQDQWEPDGQGGDDYAGTPVDAIEWQDQNDDPAEPAPADPRSEITADAEPDSGEDAVQLDPRVAADDLLDPDSLRELVADIVREELQGVLGERITRNVRKLVRREIQRALTAQDMD